MSPRAHRTVRAWIFHRVRAGGRSPQKTANCGAIDSDTDSRGTASPTATPFGEWAPHRRESSTLRVIPETRVVEPRGPQWVMAPTGTRVGRVADRCYVVLAHADRVEDETLRAGIRDSATDLATSARKPGKPKRSCRPALWPPNA